MANTTNFGWETPDDTDLVKDGAAAIRTLGQAIDTSLADLEGGTTGQVLAKNSNTDMDFIWVTSDDANAIQNAIVDAKGDIVAASANDTPARLAVGTDNHRLIAASGETTGLKYVSDTQNTVIDAEGDLLVGDAADAVQRLAVGTTGQILTVDTAVDGKIKWATPAGGGKILQVVSTNDNTKKQVSNATEYTEIATAITPSSASSRILIMVSFGLVSNSTNADSAFRIKRDSTAIQQGTGGTVNINQSFFMAEGSSEGSGYTIQVVDSPATTSAITYKVELLANTGTININRRGLDTYYAASSSMTLMEIGA